MKGVWNTTKTHKKQQQNYKLVLKTSLILWGCQATKKKKQLTKLNNNKRKPARNKMRQDLNKKILLFLKRVINNKIFVK